VSRLAALGLGSGISVLLFLWAAEAQAVCNLFVEVRLVCLLGSSLQCLYKALTSLHRTICCVQPVSAVGWHAAGSAVSRRSSNFHPSQALGLPIQEHVCSARCRVGVKEHGSSRKGSDSHLKHNPGAASVTEALPVPQE